MFLALLYETLVQMTTDKGNVGLGEVRFICEPRAAKCLGDVRLDLLSRRWPTSESKRGISDCTLEVGFRRSWFFGLLPSKDFITVAIDPIEVGRRDARAIEGMAGPKGNVDIGALSEELVDALGSTLVVLLIDASSGPPAGNAGVSPTIGTDAFNATLVSAMMAIKAKQIRCGSSNAPPSPIVVLTKFDLEDGAEPAKDHERSASDMLGSKFPLTAKALDDERPDGMRGAVKVLTSGLRTEIEEGKAVPTSVTEKGLVTICYSSECYRSLIGIIKEAAKGQRTVRKRKPRPR